MATAKIQKSKEDEAVILEEAAVEAPAEVVKEPDAILIRMYVGPTLTRYGLVQNVNYEGIPASAEEFFKACEKGRLLFVSLASYPEAERQIRTGKGYFYEAYAEASKLKNGGN